MKNIKIPLFVSYFIRILLLDVLSIFKYDAKTYCIYGIMFFNGKNVLKEIFSR